MVQRALVTVLAIWWTIKAVTMFGCNSITFDGLKGGCFDAPAGSPEGGYFVGWEAGLAVLFLAVAALVWMWIVPKLRRVKALRAETEPAAAE
jgi:hypothetical protein